MRVQAEAAFDPGLRGLPAGSGVVVIGGGVVGVSAALSLVEAGVPVLLCEKGRIAAEQSSRNWGWVRKQGRDIRELPLMIEAQALWRRHAGGLGPEIGYREAGCTYLCASEVELEAHAKWLDAARGHQLGSRLWSRRDLAARIGAGAAGFVGALHTPDDAMAEPGLAVPALARRAAALGAEIREATAVRALIRSGGRVSGVMTEHGPVTCDAVILAGGAWSRTFMENLGLALPQLAIRASVMRSSAGPEIDLGPRGTGAIGAAGASVRRRMDGGYTIARSGAARFEIIPAGFRHFTAFLPMLRRRWRIIELGLGRSFFGPLGRQRWDETGPSPFEAVRILDPVPDMRLLADVMATAQRLHPALRDVRPVQSWGGMIDVTPDELPVIDHVPQAPGLVLATGFSGHGFGIGPGAGLAAAQLATGVAPVVALSAFALDRFGRRLGRRVARAA